MPEQKELWQYFFKCCWFLGFRLKHNSSLSVVPLPHLIPSLLNWSLWLLSQTPHSTTTFSLTSPQQTAPQTHQHSTPLVSPNQSEPFLPTFHAPHLAPSYHILTKPYTVNNTFKYNQVSQEAPSLSMSTDTHNPLLPHQNSVGILNTPRCLQAQTRLSIPLHFFPVFLKLQSLLTITHLEYFILSREE